MGNFYLKKLQIQNFATFKNQTINFRPGFNAIIGETGSGKSLVLDALQLILGGRADKKVVRRDTDYSLIEASFHCADHNMKSFLENEGYPLEGNELIVKRLIYKSGITKNYINHLSCTVTLLGQFARRYIDIVGQFENQRLLSENYQLQLLDQFGKLKEEVRTFTAKLQDYKAQMREYEHLNQSRQMRDQRLDYLNFQLHEIERLNPSSQDEEDLLKRKHLLLNHEKTMKLGFQVSEIFDGGEGQLGLLGQIRSLATIIRKNPEQFSSELDPLAEVEDKLHALKSHLDQKFNAELDPSEIDAVLERLDAYQKLKKKFGGSVESILQTQVEFLKEKTHLDELELNLTSLDGKITTLFTDLNQFADQLHNKRLIASKSLSDELTARIRQLKMDKATIKMNLEKTADFLENGMTRAYFMAETNRGEGFFKIKDTASGGELSRILLALRQILSSYDSISIFLFDEIDTGIGGETANCIGKALKDVSTNGQVLAITHLPQIAQFADSLIIVNKEVHEEKSEIRTESSVKEIIGKMIQREVRSMAQLN